MIDDTEIIKRIANGNDPYGEENMDDYGFLSTINKLMGDFAESVRIEAHRQRLEMRKKGIKPKRSMFQKSWKELNNKEKWISILIGIAIGSAVPISLFLIEWFKS